MRALAWLGILALLAGCASQPTARETAAPPPFEAAAPAVKGPETPPPAQPPAAAKEGTPPAQAPEAQPPAGPGVAGTYVLELTEAQKAEIQAGLEKYRAQAKAGDAAAAEVLPTLEAAAAKAASASIRLNPDGTYLASVDGSEAKGRYRIVGDEVRFDAPPDGRPAAYPTMQLDRAKGRLVARTSSAPVSFVKKG